jgi:5-methylcytosine-specific restriction endonuclease McrA
MEPLMSTDYQDTIVGMTDTGSEHVCVIDREYPGGIMACGGCGQFWVHAPREFLKFAFIAYDLSERLRQYQLDIRWGVYDSLAEAVRAASARVLEERAAAAARARDDWHRRQRAKVGRRRKRERAIILSRPCAYCGGTATDVDHIMPSSRGGSEWMPNLAPSCHRCNVQKSNRTPAEWEAWSLRRGRPWPPPPIPEDLPA